MEQVRWPTLSFATPRRINTMAPSAILQIPHRSNQWVWALQIETFPLLGTGRVRAPRPARTWVWSSAPWWPMGVRLRLKLTAQLSIPFYLGTRFLIREGSLISVGLWFLLFVPLDLDYKLDSQLYLTQNLNMNWKPATQFLSLNVLVGD